MDDMLNKVEAVLFITGSFMTVEDIAKSAEIASEGIVKELILKLKAAYDEKKGSLEIIENEGKYKIALRKDYVPISTKLLSNTELDRSTQETLAIIAYKQPILQADLIKIRGNGAYDHIHTLKDLQFIVSEKFGRTRKLKLAPKFFEYFDIAGDQLKAKCDEIGQKVGTVERLEEKKPKQASLNNYDNKVSVEEGKGESQEEQAAEEDGDKGEEAKEEKEEAKAEAQAEPDDIQPDPEDINPEEPEPKAPKKEPPEEEAEKA